MKGACPQKTPHFFFILVSVVISLSFLPAGQARPGVAFQGNGTTAAFDPAEATQTPAETESPPSETPSPSPATPSPTDTPLPIDDFAGTPAEQTLLLVGLSSSANLESFESSIPYQVVDIGLQGLGIYAVRAPEAQANEILASLSSLPGVRYAEPNYTVTGQETLPSDPALPLQYALTNIRAPQAWDITTGSGAVTIAMIDSGVDLSHPELAPKLLPGYDFVNGDTIPQDDNGHGTHVAGIAAAASDNGLGMAGVSWGARILPVKVLNASNAGSYANVAAGIAWAVDHGAQVINLSLGGGSPSETLEDAVNYAVSRGVALVAAAGNTSGDILYPARYPAVIAVANTNAANQRVSSSGFGTQIDLAAPGASIYSLSIGGGYRYRSGTSMSTPHVSGGLALLLSLPGVGAGQARAWLEASALDLDPPGWDIFTGSGLIQLDSALLLANSASPTNSPSPTLFLTTDTPPSLPTSVWVVSSPAPTVNRHAASLTIPAATSSPTAPPTLSSTPAVPLISHPPGLSPSPTMAISPSAAPPATARFQWMPCLGALMLLLGLLLAAWAARARPRR